MQVTNLRYVLLLIVSSFVVQGILGQTTGQVGFLVQFTSSYVVPPASGPHVFDNVIFNHGNGYSSSTGKFTAQLRGVYFFSAQLFTSNKERILVDIRKNGTPISRIALNTTQPGDAESVSTSLVIPLNANDQVWVETANPTAPGTYLGLMHTFFSGFMLYSY